MIKYLKGEGYMFRLILIMLSFSVYGKEFSEELLHIQPISWEELQVFQSDSLKSAESLDLSESCPTDLDGIKELEQMKTAFKVILWNHYYWTGFKDKNGLKCLVKHTGFKFNPNQKLGPFFYEILNTQQARTLLSARESIGFNEKGLYIITGNISKHNQAISGKPYKKYGGFENMVTFMSKNPREIPSKKNDKDREYIDANGVRAYKSMSFIEGFESYYNDETLNKLIEKVKSESATKPIDDKYPFQSKDDLRKAIEADLKLLDTDNDESISDKVDFFMQLIKPAPKITWE